VFAYGRFCNVTGYFVHERIPRNITQRAYEWAYANQLKGTAMTTTERTDRDLRIWQIKDIMRRVGPEDMTDAELVAVIAILGLADVRLSPKPMLRITRVVGEDKR
jgi:hypothetical protein